MDVDGVFCGSNEGSFMHAILGESWLRDQKPHYKIAMKLHLLTAIPAGFLVMFQFIFHNSLRPAPVDCVPPAQRLSDHGAGRFHNRQCLGRHPHDHGRRRRYADRLWTQCSHVPSLYDPRHLPHQKIADRPAPSADAPGVVYAGSIWTLRVLLFEAAAIMSMAADGYYYPMPCAEVATFHLISETLVAFYPTCADLTAWVAVRGDLFGRVEKLASIINGSFGMAWWLGLAINAIASNSIYNSSLPRLSGYGRSPINAR